MRKHKAFTLIELLVAVTIFSVIAVVLYSCFRGGVISYGRIEKEAEFQQKIRSSFLKMTKDLRNMLYIRNIPFQGYEDSISFVTTISESRDKSRRAGCVKYYLKDTEEGSLLARKENSLKEVLSSLETAEEDSEKIGSGAVEQEPVMLKGVEEIKFSYLYAEDVDAYGAEEASGENAPESAYQWLDLWEIDTSLPLGIKIELLLSAPGGNGQMRFSRQVFIPITPGMAGQAALLEAPLLDE